MISRPVVTVKVRAMAIFPLFCYLFAIHLQADDVDRLIQGVKNERNAERRADRALFLGAPRDPRAVEPLIAALKDEDWRVRNSAAHALGRIGDTRAVGPLIETLNDPDETVRENAAAALGEIRDPRAVEPLIGLLRDKSKSVQVMAAGSLYKLGYEKDRQTRRIITAFKSAKDPTVILSAKSVLVELRDAQSANALIDMLADGDARLGSYEYLVNTYAVEVLAALGDPRAVEPLIRMLKEGLWWTRNWAAAALGEIGDSRAVEPLITALEEDEHWQVRMEAVRALGKLKDSRALKPLLAALEEEDSDIWTSAVVALHQLGYQQQENKTIERVIAGLKNQDPRTRWNAAWALGEMKVIQAADLLVAALKDEKWGVRMYAARALGQIRHFRAVESLIVALNDDNWRVRENASEALEKIAGKDFGRDVTKWRKWWEKTKENAP